MSWDSLGVLRNSRIKWTKHLKSRFSEGLEGKVYGPLTQEYITMGKCNEPKEVPDILLKPNVLEKPIRYYLPFKELSAELIRAEKKYIKDWRTISQYYPDLDYDFISEFKDHINFHALLFNPHINWSDTRLFSFYPDHYDILTCESIWTSFLCKFVGHNSIPNQLASLNQLEKFVRINWKLEERNKVIL